VGKAQGARYALVAGFAGEIMRNSDVSRQRVRESERERERERERARQLLHSRRRFGFIAANGPGVDCNGNYRVSVKRSISVLRYSANSLVLSSLGASARIRDGEGGRQVNSL